MQLVQILILTSSAPGALLLDHKSHFLPPHIIMIILLYYWSPLPLPLPFHFLTTSFSKFLLRCPGDYILVTNCVSNIFKRTRHKGAIEMCIDSIVR
jgi:hypothetical protein